MTELAHGARNFLLDEISCHGVSRNIAPYLNVVKFIEVVCFSGKPRRKFSKAYNMCGANVSSVF